jgi:sugar lactone lactonase YvrE
MTDEPELILDVRASLGEGPVWDAKTGTLWWVDITACKVHISDAETGADRVLNTGSMVGAVALRATGGLVAALANGFALIDTETGQVHPINDPEQGIEGNRFNDGKCDPGGRFWAGSCSLGCDVPGAGSLYRLSPEGHVAKVLENVTISNGLCWSPDERTMYFIDTPMFEVWAFDYDNESGEIRNRRTAVKVPQDEGYPDGMTIDVDGMLWIAHWGGSRVCRWDPRSGRKIGDIRFPVTNVSSCTFGGPDLNELYITTARLGLSEQDLQDQPLAGGLFRAKPGVTGLAAHSFGG